MIIKLDKPFKPYLTLPSCLTRPHQYNICKTLIEICSKCLIPSVVTGRVRSTWLKCDRLAIIFKNSHLSQYSR